MYGRPQNSPRKKFFLWKAPRKPKRNTMAMGMAIRIAWDKNFSASRSGSSFKSAETPCSKRSIKIKERNAAMMAYFSVKTLILFSIRSSEKQNDCAFSL